MMLVGKTSLTSDDDSMFGYGCGVSQYPQFYDKQLDRYQILQHPYSGSFNCFPGNIFEKENGLLDLSDQTKYFVQKNI